MDLTAAQWEKLKPLLAPKRRSDGRGRPWRDTQAVLNGVLWVLRTGAPWHDLPDRYPPPIKPAIGAFSSGSATVRWTDSCTRSPKTCGHAANWICRKLSSTPASARRKKGH